MSGHNGTFDKRHSSNYHDNSDGGSNKSAKYDDPPNSRLFIVCGRQITEEQFRESFGTFGTIEEIWMPKDRITGETKGITYIKFSKTSEAATAMEEMNGRVIQGSPRPLKVLIAHPRDQGSRRDMNEEERLLRLFVVVPKSMDEVELKENFCKYGDIDYVSIVRDRSTKESKGFAYVKYHRMSHAAKAFEECDKNFKPVFADPKPTKNSYDSSGGSNRYCGPGSTASGSTSASVSASYDMLSYMDTSHSNPDGLCRLLVSAYSSVNQDQIWRLFDIVPGLEFCEIPRDRNQGRNNKGFFHIAYNNPHAASYAKEKLHGFEYPPGQRLVVRFDHSYDSPNMQQNHNFGHNRGPVMNAPHPGPSHPSMNYRSGPGPMGPPSQNTSQRSNIQNDLAHLTETIANATALLQAAGYGSQGSSDAPSTSMNSQSMSGETYDPSYCSVKLPPPKPLAAMDSPVVERLFIVCSPVPPQLYALKDVFGRFGSLVDIYLLSGKSCGYAKYASKESANKAIATLHGQEICGSRLKVMPADPQDKSSAPNNDSSRKRAKLSDDQ